MSEQEQEQRETRGGAHSPGRPVSPNSRRAWVGIRLAATEKDLLADYARAANLTVSQIVRRVLREAGII